MRTLVLMLVTCVSLVLSDSHGGTSDDDDKKIIDLTHTVSNRTIYYPLNPSFNFSEAWSVVLDSGYRVVSNYFQSAEHTGTHMDAPRHFCGEDSKAVHEISMTALHGPGVVLDFRSEAEANSDFVVTSEHIMKWEETNGKIPDKAFVLLNFGWDKYFGDFDKVYGTDDIWNFTSYRVPGMSAEGAAWLTSNRNIRALGTDTTSPDPGTSTTYPVHVNLLCNYSVIILENVANLGAMPIKGTTVFAGVYKLKEGGGAPMRLFAVENGAAPVQRISLVVLVPVALALLVKHRLC